METATEQAGAPAAPAANPLRDDALLAQLGAEATGEAANDAPQADQEKVPTDQLVSMVLGPLFAVLAPNWKVTAGEVDQLSKVYGAVLDKYVPDVGMAFGVELSALLVTAAIVGPRVAMKVPPRREEKDGTPRDDA